MQERRERLVACSLVVNVAGWDGAKSDDKTHETRCSTKAVSSSERMPMTLTRGYTLPCTKNQVVEPAYIPLHHGCVPMSLALRRRVSSDGQNQSAQTLARFGTPDLACTEPNLPHPLVFFLGFFLCEG